MELSPPRGTRDFYPEDLRLRSWLFEHFRQVARAFAFEEYDAPVVEHEELYIRKAGEEITQQLYNFEDKGGRKLALRPEMTPSLARMILQRGGSLPLPAKWFSLPQCWRYERMTRGRKREHFQWNMDIVGVSDVTAEVELLSALRHLFLRLGLGADAIGIRISNRGILQSVTTQLKIPIEQFPAVCVIVDKLEKQPRAAIEGELKALGLSSSVIDEVLAVISLKEIAELRRALADQKVVDDIERVFELAAAYSLSDWLVLDPSIVRGLAYYTGIIFEGFDRSGELRAVCGGGRYDRLLSTFGGADIPAAGFGFGDVVILEVLKDRQKLPTLSRNLQDVVFSFDAMLRAPAMQLADRLRSEGRSVDVVLDERKVKWALKHADRLGAERILLLGPDEFAKRQVKVKVLATGEESELAL